MELPRPPRKSAASRQPERPARGVLQAGTKPLLVTPSSAASKWTVLAILVRPHGQRGEIIADILTDFPERFSERRRLFLIPPPRIGTAAREVLLESFWFLRNRLVLKIQGIDSINDAESLRGYQAAIPAAERAHLEDGSVYIGDLIGCHVADLNQSGADLGEVVDVDRGSSNTDLLVLRRPGKRGADAEALIPFVQDYVIRLDVAARRIEMRLPEGLLDINAPMTEEEKREHASRSPR
ncbi:MAG TPA: ribosome maturation factor RimM [Acidobacteriaceae bacterium]|nr:ribosome maturation factor RimM [Acidobacteriaceae bacterium]